MVLNRKTYVVFFRLVVGSALGSITSLFEKVSAIDKKHGKFSVLLCAGDFFGDPSMTKEGPDEVELLLDGKIIGEHRLGIFFSLLI